jgi:hypothetical protein
MNMLISEYIAGLQKILAESGDQDLGVMVQDGNVEEVPLPVYKYIINGGSDMAEVVSVEEYALILAAAEELEEEEPDLTIALVIDMTEGY